MNNREHKEQGTPLLMFVDVDVLFLENHASKLKVDFLSFNLHILSRQRGRGFVLETRGRGRSPTMFKVHDMHLFTLDFGKQASPSIVYRISSNGF
jgi:hypothetical protein